LGNEHPLENGFAFLNPYGLPYLAGSGVKGVLRAAARELASGQWDSKEWLHAEEPRHEVRDKQGKPLFDASDIDVLFGSEALDGENHLRGVLSFWDVIPQIEGHSLMVDIMTPHQSHYYQEDTKKGAVSTSPHDSGSPNPISFLTVPPGSVFAFHVLSDSARLEHLAPDLANNERWKVLLTEASEHAFAWLGFGAKTSVGYGAMDSETMRRMRKVEAQQQAQEERELRKQKDAERQEQNAQVWAGVRIKFNRANKSLSVEKDGQTAVAIQPKGEELLNTLPADVRTKIMGNQFVKVVAFVAESVLVKVQPTS
jgi:CRISPR-associated protein Cmr6